MSSGDKSDDLSKIKSDYKHKFIIKSHVVSLLKNKLKVKFMGFKFYCILIHVNNSIFRIILEPTKKTLSKLSNSEARMKVDVKFSDALIRKHFFLRLSNHGNDIVDKIVAQAKQDKANGKSAKPRSRQVNFLTF